VNPQPRHAQQKKIVATLAVLVVTAVIVLGVKALTNRSAAVAARATSSGIQATAPASSAPAPTAAAGSGSSKSAAATYKDGSYNASGSYNSPGGLEGLKVSVTLQNDVITATSAQPGANDPDAQQFQDDFIANYKQFVVGKDINTVQLSNVAGSSLTSQGFNDALDRIKSQAKT
jgi:uncharacterized protein with FMN-binding domain